MQSNDAERSKAFYTTPLTRRAALRGGATAMAATALAAAGLSRPGESRAAPIEIAANPTWKQPQTDPAGSDGGVAAALAQLDGVVADIMGRTGVPGVAVAVVHEDQMPYAKGFGVREAGTDKLVDPETVFQLASVSKPVGSTVMAAIIGDGLVSWNSRLSDLTPEVELMEPYPSREVTLLDLYTHRSGLPDHIGDLIEDIGYDRATILHRLRYAVPEYSFRSGYAYTNFGVAAAAFAAASAAGLDWSDLSEQRLYQRAGMTRTSSRFADYAAHENRALLHQEVDGVWVARYVRDNDAGTPAGGVSSTVTDMARWMRLQLGNGNLDGEELVNSDALADTHRPWTLVRRRGLPQEGNNGAYGLGWNVGINDAGQFNVNHSGAFYLGAATAVFLVPALQVGIVVLTNGWPIGVPESIALSFLDLVNFGQVRHDYLSIFGPIVIAGTVPRYETGIDYTQPPAGATPPLSLEAYAGVYENALYGPLEIVVEGDVLVMFCGPEPQRFDMIHYDRDVFAYQPRGENASVMSAVTFTIGDESFATTVLIDFFNIAEHPQGTFWRAVEAVTEE